MLKQIYCEKFVDKTIDFKNGLNIILGDLVGTNSIGKTTMLYIIDYVFGGSSYVPKNKVVIDKIGDHTVFFAFEFDKMYYFSKKTSTDDVTEYSDHYSTVKQIMPNAKYLEFLKDKYNLQNTNDSFRNIIGRFSRIYRMGTSNPQEPFASTEKEPKDNSIKMLLNLFEKSQLINEIRKQKDQVNGELKTFNAAKKIDLVPTITKREMDKNVKEIISLEREKEEITLDGQLTALTVDAIVSKEVVELRNRKSKYIIALTSVENDITKLSISKEKEYPINYQGLNELFPDISIKKIEEIQSFHKTLKENLSLEILEYISVLENKKRLLLIEISKCDEELKKISNTKQVPIAILSKYSSLDQRIAKMTIDNNFYLRGEDIKKRKKLANEAYDKAVNETISEIELTINRGIVGYRELIEKKDENQSPPRLELQTTNYKMDFNVDTGTGTAFSTLIILDLIMLKETKLPYVIEDTIIFKHISNLRMKKIIDVYNKNDDKQIFIALDKINDYGKEFADIANKKKVVELSDEKPLFGMKFSATNT